MEGFAEFYVNYIRLNLWWVFLVGLVIIFARNRKLLDDYRNSFVEYWNATMRIASGGGAGLLLGDEFRNYTWISLRLFWVAARYAVLFWLPILVLEIVLGIGS